MQYMQKKANESYVYFLLRDFSERKEELNKHLDLILKYTDVLPKGSSYYRARVVHPEDYSNLDPVIDSYSSPVLWGYAPQNMLAPPAEMATDGRANRAKEPFIYLANKPEVCCAEVRPIFTEEISVMKFTLKNDIKIINIKSCIPECSDCLEYEVIKQVMISFVDPVKKQDNNSYSLTQYISSYIREKGYDGIMYGTLNSIDSDSFNLVLFNEENVTWNPEEKSDVYQVISKSIILQNLTTKVDVKEVTSGYTKLEIEDIDELIHKLHRLKYNIAK